MVAIEDAPDADAVQTWLTELIAGQFAYVVLMTGEALRRLIGFAERDGRRETMNVALAKTRLVTRGPKPVQALKEIGLTPQIIATTPTTEGVIAALEKEPVAGKTVGYTLFGSANPKLAEFLQHVGAIGRPVLSYVYAPAADADRVVELIEKMSRGEVDMLMITSSPQVDRLFEVAKAKQLETALTEGLQRTRIAAVGPVAAHSLEKHNARVDIMPTQGFVMKNLVQYAKKAFEE
jgi:uroporphyrinogen-III synthase